MAFVPFASWNSRSITHLANYLSRSSPMNSSDESIFTIRSSLQPSEWVRKTVRSKENHMVKANSAIPDGFRSLTPYLIVDSAKNFLEFIRNAFGTREKFLMRDENGAIRHAEARIGDSIIEFAEAGPGWRAMPAGLHHY